MRRQTHFSINSQPTAVPWDCPGQAIAWGAWSGLGEAEEQRERIAEHLETRGTGWITPAHGLRAFERSGARGLDRCSGGPR